MELLYDLVSCVQIFHYLASWGISIYSYSKLYALSNLPQLKNIGTYLIRSTILVRVVYFIVINKSRFKSQEMASTNTPVYDSLTIRNYLYISVPYELNC